MISNDEFIAKRLHKKIDAHLKTGDIEIVDEKDQLSIDHHFDQMGFPRRIEEIHWEIVPNSEHYLVKIPTRMEESRDFTTRIIDKYNLSGPVILYGDYFLMENYRMDVSFLPTTLWDFIGVPICLYAVSLEQNWCFSFHSSRHLNFGYAPNSLPK
ncbi:hypothetical protein [uncultured Kiloniella sp.]|uniref:hypothetical protein n=1 Tax=uncultured Kiloniella sp. TaxID=1133091 RepID=UPI002619A4C2|nr:hypothetical protein [uncultured Kiloniella sp.]